MPSGSGNTSSHIPYVGNGPYCYSNATAMLLSSIGENISPSRIEVLTGVGLDSFLVKGTNILFFSGLVVSPDIGIKNALDILGFSCKESSSQNADSFPIKELGKSLANSPAILGPLSMIHLNYNPFRLDVPGIDHYVVALEADNKEVRLYDPAGFPYVLFSLEQLKLAWKAEDITYRSDFYHYWISPVRIKEPTEEEIYNQALKLFKSNYLKSEAKAADEGWIINCKAITTYASFIRSRKVDQDEIRRLLGFLLPLGARRALDFASFFGPYDNNLATLKRRQAKLFGKCQAKVVEEDWNSLADIFNQLAAIEEELREKIIKKN